MFVRKVTIIVLSIGLIGILGCIRNLQLKDLIQEQELVRVDAGIRELTVPKLERLRRLGIEQNYTFHSDQPGATYILPEVRSMRKMIIFMKGELVNEKAKQCGIYIHRGSGKWQNFKKIEIPVPGKAEIDQFFQTDAIRIDWHWGGKCSVEKIELYGLRKPDKDALF